MHPHEEKRADKSERSLQETHQPGAARHLGQREALRKQKRANRKRMICPGIIGMLKPCPDETRVSGKPEPERCCARTRRGTKAKITTPPFAALHKAEHKTLRIGSRKGNVDSSSQWSRRRTNRFYCSRHEDPRSGPTENAGTGPELQNHLVDDDAEEFLFAGAEEKPAAWSR